MKVFSAVVVSQADLCNKDTVNQIVDVIHKAFEERSKQGLFFGVANVTSACFVEKYSHDAIVFIAKIDEAVVGTASVKFYYNNKKELYAFFSDLAVDPVFKRRGVGSALETAVKKSCIEHGCLYMECTTAAKADSAIRIHKKHGYRVCGFKSFDTTNYYSVVMKCPLNEKCVWNSKIYCYFIYILSVIRTLLLYKKNGIKRF